MFDLNHMRDMCQTASETKYQLQKLSKEVKNQVLYACADALIANKNWIILENAKDLEQGKKKGMSSGLLDRLKLDETRIFSMSEGLRQIAALDDPIGEIIDAFERPNGLNICKVRVPIGVIGIIYESRPNVTADAFGLCFKTGNVVILKGGSDALCSNKAIVSILQKVLREAGLPQEFINLITDTEREATKAFMKMNSYVDLLIPRGGAGLIKSVVENSTIPVIETGTGNCHIFVDEEADIDLAVAVIVNAKTQRIGVCNACESLVIHEKIKHALLPKLASQLLEKKVEIRGDEAVLELIPEAREATELDYGTEYLDYILSIKTVSSLEEAIAHINHYNTGHSEAIITTIQEHADIFLKEIDAACVYVNASTRFTDGFEFGFGAEIGISTQMLHARGPMGLKELTSYKYYIRGNGQIRA